MNRPLHIVGHTRDKSRDHYASRTCWCDPISVGYDLETRGQAWRHRDFVRETEGTTVPRVPRQTSQGTKGQDRGGLYPCLSPVPDGPEKVEGPKTSAAPSPGRFTQKRRDPITPSYPCLRGHGMGQSTHDLEVDRLPSGVGLSVLRAVHGRTTA